MDSVLLRRIVVSKRSICEFTKEKITSPPSISNPLANRQPHIPGPGAAVEIREPVAPRPGRSHTIAKLKDPFLSPGRVWLCVVLKSHLDLVCVLS